MANPSSDYETCALSLAWSAMGLDADSVKVLMMLEMKILKVMVAVVMFRV